MPKCENCSKWRCICNKNETTPMTLSERLEMISERQLPEVPPHFKTKKMPWRAAVFHGYSKIDPEKRITTPFISFEDLYQLPISKLQNLRMVKSKDFTLLHIASRFFGQQEIDFCVNQLGIDLNVSDSGTETPIITAAYTGRLENVEYLRMLGAEERPEIKEKLSLWEKFGEALVNIEGIWKPVGRSPISFGNRIHVHGRKASVFLEDIKIIDIPFGIFQRPDSGQVGFSWKGHAWNLEIIQNAQEELSTSGGVQGGGVVWRRA